MEQRKLCIDTGILLRFLLIVIIALITACGQITPKQDGSPSSDGFALTILHTNDTHSAYAGSTDKGLPCYDGICEKGSGGYVRLDQAVRAIRMNKPNALFLDAGDIFQGTLFWNFHKEKMPLALVDKMNYQALTPGNHEFDDTLKTWLNYVAGLNIPILASNIVLAPPPKPPVADKIHPFIIVEREGRKIGIVGLITEETPDTSNPGPGITFTKAKAALEGAVNELAAQNVTIVIALVHLGLENEKLLASQVDGVDIVVGGHSHSLLSNNPELKPEGPYPVVVRTPSGKPALVVTAASACKYLGNLEVVFDAQGVAQQWNGDPILLNEASLTALRAPERNKEIEAIIDNFGKPIRTEMEKYIGQINATGIPDGYPLEESGVAECRNKECLSGNIMVDAMRTRWSRDEVQIAILNGGSIRNSLPNGKVTQGHVLGALPFQNTLVRAWVRGDVIRKALEHSVENYGQNEGRFLQVSGLRYAFNPSSEKGKRITRVDFLNDKGQWEPLDSGLAYHVITLKFLAEGGDGFNMLLGQPWKSCSGYDYEAVVDYIKRFSPVKAARQGRITIEK